MRRLLEVLLFRYPVGLASRCRVVMYRLLGMRIGRRTRLERVRVRRPSQIAVGSDNALSRGCWLWPSDEPHDGVRIRIGSHNYFNRNVMIDACGLVEIGDGCMFGPDIYITDSNHTMQPGKSPWGLPIERGEVRIGDRCWIGAKAVLLKDVTLGVGCVVGAGAVVTKSFPDGSVIAGVPAKLVRTIEQAAPAP